MEPLVKKIIAMDMAARSKVEQAKHARSDVKKQVEQSKAEIEAKATQDAKQRLADLKQQYEEEIKAAQQASDANYTHTLTELQKKFQNSKDVWLKEIVERCIHE
ncbi:hypothetical protein D5266_02255 [bacterium c-19]|nr:hypothetical protein [bacterium c-19]